MSFLCPLPNEAAPPPIGLQSAAVPFKTSLCRAPCENFCCCCISFCCLPCATCVIRKRLLNQDMTQYRCCQGHLDRHSCNCCCKAGHCNETSCPSCCLCLESFCCTSCSLSSSRMAFGQIQPDACDYRLIIASNVTQVLVIVAIVVELGFPGVGSMARNILEVFFSIVGGCIVAQIDKELREGQPPSTVTVGAVAAQTVTAMPIVEPMKR
eukprot:c5805_g1_i1.p1 GENE.c5805_g1_i1~~c5805_g1_i1.p1  ORF type:complete len:222 (-),score=25.62 c5805_g1_i1:23-652(-)